MPPLDDETLEKVREIMAKEPPLLFLKGKIMVAGDTHGDVMISREVIKKFFSEKYDFLVFLGDYVDREPEGVDAFSNINFLLETKLKNPKKIFLLKGNHEAYHFIPFHSNFFIAAGEKYVGYDRIFREMPLAAMANNVFLSHAGFPYKGQRMDKNDERAVEDITWSDIDISPVYRGAGRKFGREELYDFLDGMGAAGFIRGHDYHFNGIVVYEKCLTIFSSRLYENEGNGGILLAEIDGEIKSMRDISLKNFSGGIWKEYEPRLI